METRFHHKIQKIMTKKKQLFIKIRWRRLDVVYVNAYNPNYVLNVYKNYALNVKMVNVWRIIYVKYATISYVIDVLKMLTQRTKINLKIR